MTTWQEPTPFPKELRVEPRGNAVSIGLPEGPASSFRLMHVPLLTSRTVADVLARADRSGGERLLVTYLKGTKQARDALRGAGVSYSGWDGRAYIQGPGFLVVQDDRNAPHRSTNDASSSPDNSRRNPFAKRSSRVPRWLLLHPDQRFGVGELSEAVDLDPSSVSRVLRTLEDDAYVEGFDEGRNHVIRMDRPIALADAWLPQWSRRRINQETWDIGARDPEDAVARVREAAAPAPAQWAIGGLAGAALHRRVVEPSDVRIWVDQTTKLHLADAMQPIPSRRGRGTLQIALTPDPWTLSLAERVDGLPVADYAQLWLDCSSEGERALEAADAMAVLSGWHEGR